jgi:hypothetical protein
MGHLNHHHQIDNLLLAVLQKEVSEKKKNGDDS